MTEPVAKEVFDAVPTAQETMNLNNSTMANPPAGGAPAPFGTIRGPELTDGTIPADIQMELDLFGIEIE
jgi:hypothetical protein